VSELREQAGRALELALGKRVPRAEAYGKRSATVRLQIRPDARESVLRSVEEGIALRVELEDGEVGFGFSSDTRPEGIEALARAVVRDAGPGAPLDLPEAGPTVGNGNAPALGEEDPLPALERLAERLRAALGRGERAAVEAARLQLHAGRIEVALLSSAGFAGTYARPLCYVAVEAVARREKRARGALLLRAAREPGDLDPEELAERIALRAAAPMGGGALPSGTSAAVIDADAAADLLQEVARHWTGTGRPRAGDRVASEVVTVIDDGRLAGGPLEAPFDGEGTPTRRTVVVEEGLLLTRLLDRAAARAEGTEPTGNAVRHSFRDPPASAPTHLSIAPGEATVEQLLVGLARGLYVTNLRAVGSRPGGGLAALVEGVWVERGRAAGAVSRALLVVPRRELLRRVRAVAGDLRYHPAGGAVGSPTLLLEPVELIG
jgi:PmbA protein